MITLNIGIEFGSYNVAYTAKLVRWPTWPVDAKFLVKLTPLGLELKIVFEVEGFKMEFMVITL
jgi:hypothetical protein